MKKTAPLLSLLVLTGCGMAVEAAPAPSTTITVSTTATTVYEAPETTTAPSTTTTTTTTVPPTTTTTLLAGDWACPEAITIAARVGWPVEELGKLDRIIWRESRCDASARSTTHDTGLTQINDFWCRSTAAYPAGFLQTAGVVNDCTDLYDPETSLRASLVIWERSGWQPWGG